MGALLRNISDKMKYLIITGFLFTCGKTGSPQITYNNSTGHARIRYGKDIADLGFMPVKPDLATFTHPKLGTLYLVKFSRGDSCPAQYLALLYNTQYKNLGEVGNCNDVQVKLTFPKSIKLEFAETDTPELKRKKILIDISENGIGFPP